MGRRLITLVLAAGISMSLAEPRSNSSICHGQEGWAVTFEDDFEQGELDPAIWSVSHNATHGSQERQLYVDSAISVEHGTLVITTRSHKEAVPPSR